jgi:hypothetical protein
VRLDHLLAELFDRIRFALLARDLAGFYFVLSLIAAFWMKSGVLGAPHAERASVAPMTIKVRVRLTMIASK